MYDTENYMTSLCSYWGVVNSFMLLFYHLRWKFFHNVMPVNATCACVLSKQLIMYGAHERLVLVNVVEIYVDLS